jgi:hypothetical protein
VPLPSGLVSYTPLQLERLAEELFLRRPDIDFVAPVNMERLLNHPDIDLRPEMGLRAKHRVEGCVCKQFMSRQLTVYVDWTIAMIGPWSGYNAVLAEEFAHIHLHQAVVHSINEIEDFLEIQRDPQWRRIERDARTFGAAIRMPCKLVIQHAEREYRRVISEHGFVDPVRTEMTIAAAIAGNFRVNPEEMRHRMVEWPCNLRSRIFNSVMSRSDELAPDDWSLELRPPNHQSEVRPVTKPGW